MWNAWCIPERGWMKSFFSFTVYRSVLSPSTERRTVVEERAMYVQALSGPSSPQLLPVRSRSMVFTVRPSSKQSVRSMKHWPQRRNDESAGQRVRSLLDGWRQRCWQRLRQQPRVTSSERRSTVSTFDQRSAGAIAAPSHTDRVPPFFANWNSSYAFLQYPPDCRLYLVSSVGTIFTSNLIRKGDLELFWPEIFNRTFFLFVISPEA